MFNDLYKQFKKVNDKIDSSKQESNQKIFAIELYLNEIRTTVNELIEVNKSNDNYIEALKFFAWFKWDKLSSNKLICEIKNKPLAELPMPDTFVSSFHLNKLDAFKQDKPQITNVVVNGSVSTVSTMYYPNICATSLTVDDVLEAIEKKNNKEEKKKEAIPYSQCVGGLVANFYNYDRQTLYKTYKYLLTILEKDNKITEYRRKYGD